MRGLLCLPTSFVVLCFVPMVLLPGSRDLGVPHVPPEATSGPTIDIHTTGLEKLF